MLKPTEYVVAGDLRLPVHFGTLAFEVIEEMTQERYAKLIEEVMAGNPKATLIFCFAGVKVGHMREQLPCEMTREKLAFIADDYPDVLADIVKVFVKQNAPVDMGKGKAAPKKVAAVSVEKEAAPVQIATQG